MLGVGVSDGTLPGNFLQPRLLNTVGVKHHPLLNLVDQRIVYRNLWKRATKIVERKVMATQEQTQGQ